MEFPLFNTLNTNFAENVHHTEYLVINNLCACSLLTVLAGLSLKMEFNVHMLEYKSLKIGQESLKNLPHFQT